MSNIFKSISQSFEILLMRFLLRYVVPFKLHYLVSGYLVLWVLYIFWILTHYWMWSWWIFFHSVGCPFVLLMASFTVEKNLHFMRSHVLIIDLDGHDIGVLFRKSLVWVQAVPYILLNDILCVWFSVEILDTLGHECLPNDKYWYICILLYTDIYFNQYLFLA